MNYLKTYFKLVRKALSETRKKSCGRYYESHHIRPQSLNGSNKSANKVLLTAREHFIAHALLAKSFKRNVGYKHKMIKAFHMMGSSNNHHERYMNSRLFETNKNRLYGPNAEVPPPMKGKKHSQKTKDKQSKARLGSEFSEEHKANLSKNSAWKGKPTWNKGKIATEEARKNQSIAQLNAVRIKCPHCEKVTTKSAMTRHIRGKHKEKEF